MHSILRWFLIIGAAWLAFAIAYAQDETTDVPDSIDLQYVESIDPYAQHPAVLLAFDYEEYANQAGRAYEEGDYELAAKYYIALIGRNIDDQGALYNLACCYGLLDYGMMAGFVLEAAFDAGFEGYEWAAQDPDLAQVRDDPQFQESWARIGELVAEQRAGLGQEANVEATVFLGCRVHVPADFDPERAYPLVVGLHGYGSNPDRFGRLLESRNIEQPGFIFAAPQAPYPFLPAEEIGYSWITGSEDDEELWLEARRLAIDYVAAVVVELEARYQVSEVYLLGFSQGCAMAYNAGLTHHELFDGLICFGGWLESERFDEEQFEAASHLPVFIGQGTEDTLVEPQAAVEARNILEAHGFTVEYYEFTGGHTVAEDMLKAALAYFGL